MAKRIEAISKDGRARMSIPTSGLTKAQIKQVKEWQKKIKKSGWIKVNIGFDWEKHFKNDLNFKVNLTMYRVLFHKETNGISVVKRRITKTFKKWLKTQKIGDILLKELELREAKLKRAKKE